MRTLACAMLATLLMLPAVQAQDPTGGLALSLGTLSGPIPYDGNASMTATVTVGCATLLQNIQPPSTSATVQVTNATPPSWLVVTPASIVFDAAACAPPNLNGNVSGTGAIGLKVKPEAPGVVVQHPVFTATLLSLNASQNGDFNVTYHAAHTITPSITFPHNMTGGQLNFTVTVTVDANARSMVMFESVRASPGAVSGLTSDYYQPGETKVFNITYTAPSTPWTQANVTFFSYSHYLLEGSALAGSPELESNTTWVVKNGNEDGGVGTESSPIPVTLMLVALVASLVVVRRKR